MISLGKIKIHIGFFVLIIFSFFYGNILDITLAFIAVTIHELSHIIVSYFLGGNFSEIIITPVGQNVKINNFWSLSPIERILILVSGPFSNIIICFLLLFFINVFETFKYNYIFLKFSYINMIYAIFNFIPILPLDGGNILYSVISRKYGVIRVAKFMTNIEGIFGFVLMIFGIVQVIFYPFNISFLIIGSFFFFSKRKEYLERISDFYILVVNKDRDYYKRPMRIRNILYSGDYRNVLKYFNYDDYFYVYIRCEDGFILRRNMEEILNEII